MALGQERIRKGDEYVFTCPKCQHTKPKLSVNVETDFFHCWVCGFKGQNLAPLLTGEYKREYVAELKAKTEKAPVERKYDEVKLPQEFRTLTRKWSGPYYESAMNYLADRGITKEDVLRWKLGYCEDGEYRYRIIIPSFDEYGHLNFFTGRAFYENPDTVKYKSGNFCKDIVWNDYQVDWDKDVTLVEGPFDAFRAQDNVIALQGTILHDKLLMKVVTSGVHVYMGLDTDARQKQFDIAKELTSYGVTCSLLHFQKKDLGEMDYDEINEAKRAAVVISDAMALVKVRLTV